MSFFDGCWAGIYGLNKKIGSAQISDFFSKSNFLPDFIFLPSQQTHA
jgi:hypothetical protein